MTPEDSEEETYTAVTGIFHRSFVLVCTMPWAQPKTSNNRKWSCLWQVCGRSTLGHIFNHLWTLWHSLVELVSEHSVIWHWCLSANIPHGPCLQILSVPQNHTPPGGNETKTKTEDRRNNPLAGENNSVERNRCVLIYIFNVTSSFGPSNFRRLDVGRNIYYIFNENGEFVNSGRKGHVRQWIGKNPVCWEKKQEIWWYRRTPDT